MTDLRFLIDKEQAMQVKEQVVEEYMSWAGMLDSKDEEVYLRLIYQLNEIIKRLEINN